MAVLVSGGAGYLGSVAVEQLLAAGEQVAVLDNFSTGHREAIPPGVPVFELDIHDAEHTAMALREYEVDAVLHFAAFIVVPESVEDPGKYFTNNVAGSQALLEAAREAGVKHFVFSSTAAVYGDPDSVPIAEDAAIRPLNPYGLSKRMVEQMLAWYGEAYGLSHVVFRYFNAAGATEAHGEDHAPETHLIPNILAAAEGTQPAITVFGKDYPTPDGTCIRDYIHVVDLIDAHVRAVRYLREGGASDTFNLGTQTGTSVLEVIEAVQDVTGKKVPVQFEGRRPGDADRLIASSEKARDTLGWKPGLSDIRTIVADARRWRQAHPQGYAS